MPPSTADIELSFYEAFFFQRGLEPYPAQEQAFTRIFAGDSVMVTVPTGTGKTMMAKAAIHKALELGQRAIYTTPLRALTEEKHRELSEDFGAERVGFATGDYRVNPDAPVQVVVAEILWNRIFGDRLHVPADVVVMDEGHYFNDPERGYVWEQSIIALDPRTQLIILSATVGHADRFCHWIEICRRVPMQLVESRERRVPLYHEYRESYLVEVVRELAAAGDVPAIVFVFGREACFETARLLKSCRRFTSAEEKDEIDRRCAKVLLDGGLSDELRALLGHGIGVHHAGILPRYKQLVEQLALERLIKFVVSTETISAGINLPAKRVVFPSLRKYIKSKARLVTPAEYHQMSGRAGRPQFDTEGISIALAPEAVVQEMRKEIADARKRGHAIDEKKVRKSCYSRARSEAQRTSEVVWDEPTYQQLVRGEPAELRSQTRINAEQILAIGLPDLTAEVLPGQDQAAAGGADPAAGAAAGPAAPAERPPPWLKLDIVAVVDNLLLSDRERRDAHKRLAHVTENMRALGVVDEHGRQVAGEIVGKLHGLDGLFIHYLLMNHQLDYGDFRELCEFLVDHDIIQRMLDRKQEDKKAEWIRERLREKRRESPQVTWQDVEEEYEREFPRALTRMELIHQAFSGQVPHPELHGGKGAKTIWTTIEDESIGFFEMVDRHRLAHEEGNLFTYLARVMKVARKINEATGLEQLADLERRIRSYLSVVDERLVEE
ncbi:MAG TPA: DEAD/DEAH box helicase [Kofleriaceae bacterium]|nr:DEAD/DEAH box helicase [Kofleriaceae bacterium]